MVPLAVSSRVTPLTVSVNHRCTPGRGWAIALMMRRLSGSQLNSTDTSGRSEIGGLTVYGLDPSIGNTQNSGCSFVMIQAPSLEPSGEKWIVVRVVLFRANEAREYGTGGDPRGDDVNSFSSRPSTFRRNASVLPSGDNEAEPMSSITISGSPPAAEIDHRPGRSRASDA